MDDDPGNDYVARFMGIDPYKKKNTDLMAFALHPLAVVIQVKDRHEIIMAIDEFRDSDIC